MAPNMMPGDLNDACPGDTAKSRKEREIDENARNHKMETENSQVFKKRNFKHKLNHTFNLSRKRSMIIGWAGVLCIIISYGIFMLSPVSMIIQSKLVFAEGTKAFDLWKKPPHQIYIKAYVFNVTNPAEVMKGEKLKVEEVGPFYYKESLAFSNITFNDNGTVSYVTRRQLHRVPEMPGLDPDTVHLTVPNVPIFGIASMLHDSSFTLNLGLSSLLNYLDSQPFLNLSATEFLMGYEDPLVQLAGTFIPSWIPFKTFGLLERMFSEGDNLVTMTIKPDVTEPMGTDDDADYSGQYLIDQFNGGAENPRLVANTPNRLTPNRCTFLQGATEGFRFKMNVNPNITYWVYRKAFCRSLPIRYSHSMISKRGYNAFHYKFMEGIFDSPKENPSNFCYNKEGSTSFMPSGMAPLTACYYGIPVAASFPHFYKGDPKLVQAVDGMKPDATKHESRIIIQPDLGVALEANIKMQMNVYVFDTKFNPRVRRFNGMAVPLFWFSWYFDDLKEIYTLMNLALYIGPALEFCLVVALCITGLAMVSFVILGRIIYRRMPAEYVEDGTPTRLQVIQQHSTITCPT